LFDSDKTPFKILLGLRYKEFVPQENLKKGCSTVTPKFFSQGRNRNPQHRNLAANSKVAGMRCRP
jgi:hypothetical protein